MQHTRTRLLAVAVDSDAVNGRSGTLPTTAPLMDSYGEAHSGRRTLS